MEGIDIVAAFVAGLTSVVSPCVLPMLPIILAGSVNQDPWRPALIVIGLSITFMVMGLLASLAGTFVAVVMPYVEKVAAILIIILGLLLAFNINIFKRLTFLQQIQVGGKGRWGGLLLGMSLGLIWVPCTGPILGSILLLASQADHILYGIFFLLIYAIGFSIPMLLIGYTGFISQRFIRFLAEKERWVHLLMGCILILFGIWLLVKEAPGFYF